MSISHESDNWLKILEDRARSLHSEIASLRKWVDESGGEDALFSRLAAPYFDMLRSLYEEDLPLARALEISDFIVRLEGPAFTEGPPRVSIISDIFLKVRKEVVRVAKEIAGIRPEVRRVPREMDLGLAALAPGSLFLGFTLAAPVPAKVGEQLDLVSVQTLYSAAEEAVATIGLVAKGIDETPDLDAIAEMVPDPGVRDAALVAIEHLAPTGRKGITALDIGGRRMRDKTLRHLTPETRKVVKQWTRRPVRSKERATFTGMVREIDLDARRFELRRLAERLPVPSIRCSYEPQMESTAKRLLDRVVRVSGPVERASNKIPRLLHMEKVEILQKLPRQRRLFGKG